MHAPGASSRRGRHVFRFAHQTRWGKLFGAHRYHFVTRLRSFVRFRFAAPANIAVADTGIISARIGREQASLMGTTKRCHADADAITAHWLSLQLYSIKGGRVYREALLNIGFVIDSAMIRDYISNM